ncbi:MAG: hypothetical protein OXC40_00415 [Proteobacteria bacterium]|nr:hypothetical protein [Pseudomonadota bacterium]
MATFKKNNPTKAKASYVYGDAFTFDAEDELVLSLSDSFSDKESSKAADSADDSNDKDVSTPPSMENQNTPDLDVNTDSSHDDGGDGSFQGVNQYSVLELIGNHNSDDREKNELEEEKTNLASLSGIYKLGSDSVVKTDKSRATNVQPVELLFSESETAENSDSGQHHINEFHGASLQDSVVSNPELNPAIASEITEEAQEESLEPPLDFGDDEVTEDKKEVTDGKFSPYPDDPGLLEEDPEGSRVALGLVEPKEPSAITDVAANDSPLLNSDGTSLFDPPEESAVASVAKEKPDVKGNSPAEDGGSAVVDDSEVTNSGHNDIYDMLTNIGSQNKSQVSKVDDSRSQQDSVGSGVYYNPTHTQGEDVPADPSFDVQATPVYTPSPGLSAASYNQGNLLLLGKVAIVVAAGYFLWSNWLSDYIAKLGQQQDVTQVESASDGDSYSTDNDDENYQSDGGEEDTSPEDKDTADSSTSSKPTQSLSHGAQKSYTGVIIADADNPYLSLPLGLDALEPDIQPPKVPWSDDRGGHHMGLLPDYLNTKWPEQEFDQRLEADKVWPKYEMVSYIRHHKLTEKISILEKMLFTENGKPWLVLFTLSVLIELGATVETNDIKQYIKHISSRTLANWSKKIRGESDYRRGEILLMRKLIRLADGRGRLEILRTLREDRSSVSREYLKAAKYDPHPMIRSRAKLWAGR